ncbi:MAG: hypothetical protein F6J87_02215 [Spirulina sp. SIO3F2]|nr:hypothetical protein [Spirulina sp. SIO3F2]
MSNEQLSDEQLWIVTASEPVDGSKSGNPYHPQKLASQAVQVSAAVLQTNMSRFIRVVGGIFQQAEAAVGMELEEVKLSVEVTAEGDVKLMGSGVGLEGKGAIELTFKRKQ